MLERARGLLAGVGLAERAEQKVTRLSGGQQQRVAIARALVLEPPLVSADEPTGNLDTQSAEKIYDWILRFNRQCGITFLIVTHDVPHRRARRSRARAGRRTADPRRPPLVAHPAEAGCLGRRNLRLLPASAQRLRETERQPTGGP